MVNPTSMHLSINKSVYPNFVQVLVQMLAAKPYSRDFERLICAFNLLKHPCKVVTPLPRSILG